MHGTCKQKRMHRRSNLETKDRTPRRDGTLTSEREHQKKTVPQPNTKHELAGTKSYRAEHNRDNDNDDEDEDHFHR